MPTHRRIHYQPFFQDRQYIFENYLVNEVIIRLFSLRTGRSYLNLYREMVCNLAMIRFCWWAWPDTIRG